MRLLLALLLLLAVATGWVPADANVLDPSHPVWSSPSIDHRLLASALADLRARQAREPHPLRSVRAGEAASSKRARVRRFLVIPVLYSDGPAEGPVTVDALQSRFFDPERDDSFSHYWEVASGGRLLPRGLVLPWVRLPGTRSFYENVVGGRPRLVGTRRMAEDAVCAAATLLGPWWDWDDDGEDEVPGSGDDDGFIDFLIVLHPDPGIEIQVESNGVMAVQDRLDSGAVWSSCEVGADPFVVASAVDPLGVWVHEAGHLLGLVDLYDLELGADQTDDGRASGGLGLWSLMATGTWGDQGRHPTGLDAYSRSLLGWGEEIVVRQAAERVLMPGDERWVRLQPAMDWGRERFLIEGRSPTRGPSIDRALPGEGVLIYRVDESGRACTGPDTLVVSLLQADGRQDLENHRNQGDAGDPYTGAPGADELGPATEPSSFSRHPTTTTLPPRIRVQAEGDGSYRVRLDATARPRLLLTAARFVDGELFLRPGTSREWNPRFRAVGGAITTARLRIVPRSSELVGDPPASQWIPLVEDIDGYRPGVAITLGAAAGAGGLDLPLRLEFDLDGATSTLEWSIPLGDAPGLRLQDLARWMPRVLAGGQPATFLEWNRGLVVGDFWRVTTGGDLGYGNCCELELRSPWIAPEGMTLEFLARVHTEGADPGEAFDGAAVEWRGPGRAFEPLVVEGATAVRIVALSRAATAGAQGLGGDATVWREYTVRLPAQEVPGQLRIHFASDATGRVLDREGGLQIAAVAAGAPRGTVTLEIRSIAGRELSAVLTVNPPPSSASASLWARRRPVEDWFSLAGAIDLDAQGSAQFSFTVPEEPYLEIGAFLGDRPQRLLATTGYRAAEDRLRVHPNPSPAWVQLETGAVDRDRNIEIFDLRGRRVRSLRLPAHLGQVSWDGRDENGKVVASGRYLAVLGGSSPKRVIFTLLH